jgi:hypothetical protein
MTFVYNFSDLRIAVRSKNASEVKGLLLALGAFGQDFISTDNREWHVVITDKEHLNEIPDTIPRIVMTNDLIQNSKGPFITTPQNINLVSLHESLKKVAEEHGVTDLEYY